MSKFKALAVTTVAAASIGVGSLVAAPTASAASMTCNEALGAAAVYSAAGDLLVALGAYTSAARVYGYAEGLVDAACG